jgi:hypothetical protein
VNSSKGVNLYKKAIEGSILGEVEVHKSEIPFQTYKSREIIAISPTAVEAENLSATTIESIYILTDLHGT